MSHFAQTAVPIGVPGKGFWVSRTCQARAGAGAVVDRGTTVQSRRPWVSDREMTTTARFFTISGGTKPREKSHINTCPVFGL